MVVLWTTDFSLLQTMNLRKAILQGIVLVVLYFGTWALLSKIDWVGLLRINELTGKAELELGDLIWKTIKESEREINDERICLPIDSMVDCLCAANGIERAKINVHVIRKDEVNAFALPNGHLIIYSALIDDCDDQDEIVGVISHEVAHIELNHVTKKLVNEIGLSALIAITSGRGGTEPVKAAIRSLSSTAFSRSLEKDADLKAVEYLVNANVDPQPFANFLFRMGEKDESSSEYLTWISTHPDSKERSEYILDQVHQKTGRYGHLLSEGTWVKLKQEAVAYR